MNVLQIPIASDAAHFVQEHEIFEKSFFLEFEWIEQEKFWLLHISDQERQPLALGVKLMANWPLYTHQEGKTPFTFMLLQKALGQELTRRSLAQTAILVAYEAV